MDSRRSQRYRGPPGNGPHLYDNQLTSQLHEPVLPIRRPLRQRNPIVAAAPQLSSQLPNATCVQLSQVLLFLINLQKDIHATSERPRENSELWKESKLSDESPRTALPEIDMRDRTSLRIKRPEFFHLLYRGDICERCEQRFADVHSCPALEETERRWFLLKDNWVKRIGGLAMFSSLCTSLKATSEVDGRGMDEEAAASATTWSSSLARSYSEHAALVLQHYQQHRRRPEPPRCTRSGPEFHRPNRLVGNDADDEDEAADPRNDSQRTWQISTSTSDDANGKSHSHRRKIIEMGCGDSGALTDEFSDLSLSQQRGDAVLLQPAFSSSSHNTTTTVSSIERCRMFDDEDDENLTLELDNDDDLDNEYRAYNGQRSSDNEYETTSKPAHTDVVVASLSTTSLSTATSRQRLNGIPLNRHISYENWSCEKHREYQRRRDEQRKSEIRRRELEEREKREREEKERRDYECFLDWLERKKREKNLKKELMEKELDLQKRIQDVEEKAKVAKDITLREWYRKKEEQQKALEKKELVKQKVVEEEKQKRFQDSMKAYEKWREKAKNTPRPATQGLLPHQKAKPVFTNPTPWQPLVDNGSDESDADSHGNQIKTSGTTIKSQRSKKASVKR